MRRSTSNFPYQPGASAPNKAASTAHGAVDFLRVHDRMAALLPAAARMAELQKECATLLPETFLACTVVQFEAGCLVFSAPNAALAAKLKQRLPKLQESLLQRGWQVNAIRVKVSVTPAPPMPAKPRQTKHLPGHALSALSELDRQLESSPRNAGLKAAVQAMLERHRNTGQK
ncbi:MAG: DciA family protein [Burkholderiaceae bacterium]